VRQLARNLLRKSLSKWILELALILEYTIGASNYAKAVSTQGRLGSLIKNVGS
jgi:hypothetical protein